MVARVAVLCVTGALLTLVLRQSAPVMGLVLTLCVTVVVLAFLLRSVGELAVFFRDLGERSGLPPSLLGPLYKTAAIAIVARIGSALCQDAGETALAAAVETAGTVCVLLTALPLLREMTEMLLKLME